MSAYATSSPSIEQTRWYLIRPPSLACTCRKEMSWLSVAEYSLTGTLTSPNDTAPFQIARMCPPYPLRQHSRCCSITHASDGRDWRHASDARHAGDPGPHGRRMGARGQVGRDAGARVGTPRQAHADLPERERRDRVVPRPRGAGGPLRA